MSKGVKVKEGNKMTKSETYATLKALYFSGKVKPSLNKILVELKNDPENLELSLLACQCLVRTKNFDDLTTLEYLLLLVLKMACSLNNQRY